MILATMESIIRSKESDDDHSKVFLYYIVPASEINDEGGENQSESWRGKTYYTHNLIKRLFENSTDQVANLETKMNQLP